MNNKSAAVLRWDDLECGWECPKCGARYSTEEVARYFGYQAAQTKENFTYGYCMDCGVPFDTCDK